MADKPPAVYVLNGEDEFAISSFLSSLQARMGDTATAEMNTSRFDGRSLSIDLLANAVGAMPFLAPRRLVILTNPLAKLNSSTLREKFVALLERVPPSTALVLVENRLLTEDRERRSGKIHWLEQWAHQAGDRALFRTFPLPRGDAMISWIQERAKALEGQFTIEAAERLADQVGDEPRQVDQEIRKILTYVDFKRPVEPDDVEHLTPFTRQADIFIMVDALANHRGREAQGMLHRLLEEQDVLSIFGMVVRQFRLLLQAREVLDKGGREIDIIRELKISPYVAGKLSPQARHFSLKQLEEIYRRLLDMDEAAKTSQIEPDLALDMLVMSLSG
jgi:DNA polymerase III subunit delta